MLTNFANKVNVAINHSKWNENIFDEQDSLYDDLKEEIKQAKRIAIIGNGGSNAILEHISTDFTKRCGLHSLTLSNVSLLTCLVNDYGVENAFKQFLLFNEINSDDLLIAISSSGKSKNILNAIEYASERGAKIVFIYGMQHKNEHAEKYAYYRIYIPSDNYGIIELSTEILLHSIVEDIVTEREKDGK